MPLVTVERKRRGSHFGFSKHRKRERRYNKWNPAASGAFECSTHWTECIKTKELPNCSLTWNRIGHIVWDFQEQPAQSVTVKLPCWDLWGPNVHVLHRVVWVAVTVCGDYNSKSQPSLQKSPSLSPTGDMRRNSDVLSRTCSSMFCIHLCVSLSLSCTLRDAHNPGCPTPNPGTF